jgi:hypothetical protein
MTGYLPDINGELKVKLSFVSNDKIDFVGLDISEQAEIKINYADLISAIHSEYGNVKALLLYNDKAYVDLSPEQQIFLSFAVPVQKAEKRAFIVNLRGYYYTIG